MDVLFIAATSIVYCFGSLGSRLPLAVLLAAVAAGPTVITGEASMFVSKLTVDPTEATETPLILVNVTGIVTVPAKISTDAEPISRLGSCAAQTGEAAITRIKNCTQMRVNMSLPFLRNRVEKMYLLNRQNCIRLVHNHIITF